MKRHHCPGESGRVGRATGMTSCRSSPDNLPYCGAHQWFCRIHEIAVMKERLCPACIAKEKADEKRRREQEDRDKKDRGKGGGGDAGGTGSFGKGGMGGNGGGKGAENSSGKRKTWTKKRDSVKKQKRPPTAIVRSSRSGVILNFSPKNWQQLVDNLIKDEVYAIMDNVNFVGKLDMFRTLFPPTAGFWNTSA
ncbi:hypothetical protein B0O99DRAFT_587730 [Bisporella sp. PMI_857]|nr:hypothetical protein B0O99DRAFT_587730 [Bisporella sp. PMI_857]